MGKCFFKGAPYESNVTTVKALAMDLYKVDSNHKLTLVEPNHQPGRIGQLNKVDFYNHYQTDDDSHLTFDIKISEGVVGYLISGNHRHLVKMRVKVEDPTKFNSSTYWSQTRTQIYVGLSPEQARFLGNMDNNMRNHQIDDSMVSMIQVTSNF